MKQLILFLLVLIFSTQGILSQEKELETEKSPQELENYYTMKFKKKKKTAWILLGAGVGAMAIGTAIAYSSEYGDSTVVYGAGAFVAGAASVIVSIPAFIKANYFKKKAEAASSSFQVSIGTISTPQRNNFALGVSCNF